MVGLRWFRVGFGGVRGLCSARRGAALAARQDTDKALRLFSESCDADNGPGCSGEAHMLALGQRGETAPMRIQGADAKQAQACSLLETLGQEK